MNAALYYPYISITDEGLLKKSLLLWDRVEVIDPFNSPRFSEMRSIREAQELVVRSHVPTPDEQERAHAAVEKLTNRPLPSWFYFKHNRPREFIYTLKFLHKTWELLGERGLIKRSGTNSVAAWTSEAMSLVLMAIVADCCAGRTKRKVTDEGLAYQTLERFLAARSGGELKVAPQATDEVLVSVSYKTLDTSKVTLANLVRLRKKEFGTHGHLYRELRLRLLRRLEEHSAQMTRETYTESEHRDIHRDFEAELKQDYSDLAEELGLAGRDFVFSKEFGGLVVGVAGAIASPALAATWAAKGVFTVGGAGVLQNLRGKYYGKRKDILNKHVTSYLYMSKHSRFEWDFRLR